MIYNGKHMMVDSIVRYRDFAALNDPSKVIGLMETIVESIDMTMILPPITVKFPHAVSEIDRMLADLETEGLANTATAARLRNLIAERKLGTYGYSTLVMIAESHLSIHTFPSEGYYTFDCYSCKDFPHEKVVEVLTQFFGEQAMTLNVVDRLMPKPYWTE